MPGDSEDLRWWQRVGRSDGFWNRIMPKSILGLAMLLFMMSIAAAASGTVLFAYYSTELAKTRKDVNDVQGQVKDDLESAQQILDKEREAAVTDVRRQLDELQKFAASGETLSELLKQVEPSVYFVETRGENGQPSVGSAFVVASDSESSLMLTSYNAVRALTAQPSPPITLRKGDERIDVRVQSWDEANDLALLVAAKGNLPALKWADRKQTIATGDRVFVVSGLGATGGAISQGFIADTSASGIQHDAPVGFAFQGGPLIDSRGEVLGVASRTFSPLGFDPGAVFFAVPVRNACAKVLSCPD